MLKGEWLLHASSRAKDGIGTTENTRNAWIFGPASASANVRDIVGPRRGLRVRNKRLAEATSLFFTLHLFLVRNGTLDLSANAPV